MTRPGPWRRVLTNWRFQVILGLTGLTAAAAILRELTHWPGLFELSMLTCLAVVTSPTWVFRQRRIRPRRGILHLGTDVQIPIKFQPWPGSKTWFYPTYLDGEPVMMFDPLLGIQVTWDALGPGQEVVLRGSQTIIS